MIMIFGFSIFLLLEMYYFFDCPNSSTFYARTKQLTRDSFRILKDLNIEYWWNINRKNILIYN